ncbi:lipid A export permease/ATP-binding protein MsbA [Sansalvadorimonas sp. 2012CJ34-2]|uniref:Lipid A export permease/ATP-binding protein MsbA n=1 Tax=Parendozoicomonas callyspongiae TaxID=2942213 RepID=A0ABT0PFA2_9GAMM|nr:lipid A export permease/ATP-binding protein MsbA [Sansalvadorimonas sp. 2012CJ34-2]MCL6269946.1 lipid A export permease/ATP-binding protein MsbA [Sansalvadorimonas sp. 2012CJ34-2]
MTEQSRAADSGLAIYLRLLGYVRPYWPFFALSLLGYIIFAASQPMFPKLVDYFTTALIGDSLEPVTIWGLGEVSPSRLVFLVPLGMVFIAVFRGIGSFMGNYYLARVSLGVVHDLRVQLFNSMLILPNRFFDENNSGHLISRITYNVGGVTTAATDAIKVVVREGLTVIAVLGYLFWTNWKLTLLFIAIIPVIAGVVTITSKRFKKLSKKIQNTMGDVTHIASETITSHRVVRSFGGESYEKGRFFAASTDNTQKGLKMVKVGAVMTPTLQLIILCAMAALMYSVLYLQSTGATANTPGQLVGFLTAAGLLPKPLRQLSEVIPNIQKGIVAAWSVFELVDEQPEQDLGTKEVERAQGALEFKNLSFTYPGADKPALKNINFTAKPGEVIALVGRSGSGKTTLASLLPRFYNHNEGDILLDGIPIQDYRLPNLRKQIALVNQQIALFNDTVANNIAYGDLRDTDKEDIRLAARAAYAMEFIENLPEGFSTLVGENGVLLSGGQRQRLAIARAILKDAPLLILDEATSALDTESERHIQAALDGIMKSRTTLVIAHRLSTIENADRILVMDKGQIIESGSHDELLEKDGAYARLYRMQFQEQAKLASEEVV